MASTSYQEIRDSLRSLYLEDDRPWLVGFSGGKDSTMVASLVFDAVLSVPPDQRKKPVAILCTDTRNGRISHKGAQKAQRTLRSIRSCGANRIAVHHSTLRTRHSRFPACPMPIDTSMPSCGDSRFGCWTCTVVERDKASEGLLASGDERMEKLIEFRETLLFYQNPANGKRDLKRKNGSDGPGPLTIEARRELLTLLLQLQEETALTLISDDELFLIQQLWKSARPPDDGGGVARIVTRQKGIIMSDWKETNRLRELQEQIAAEKGICADTLRRLLAKVDEFSESQHAARSGCSTANSHVQWN